MTRSVILIGDPVEGGLTSCLERAFRSEGWTPQLVPWSPTRPWVLHGAAYRWPSLALPYRLDLRRRLAACSEASLAVVVKGQFIDRPMVDWVRRRFAAPVVCWNPDSPFDEAISNRGAGVPQAIGAYDHYVTWADDIANRLAARTPSPVVIPFGWDPAIHYREEGTAGAADRVVFIGSWTPDREAWIRRVAPIQPLVFGNRWKPIPGVDLRPAVSGQLFRVALGEARWSLNFLRPQNRQSHNMRTFEVPACGGRALVEASPQHEQLLAHTDARFFTSGDDLNGILSAAPPPRQSLQEWLTPHTYAHRVRTLIDHLRLATDGAVRRGLRPSIAPGPRRS